MRTEFSTFEAECCVCKHRFMHPELGDMSYGEFIFTTSDGRHHAYCNAFESGPQRIQELMGDATIPECFQAALACFADPLEQGRLTSTLRCPICASTSLLRYVGQQGQSIELPAAQYENTLRLAKDDLADHLARFQADWHA